MDVFDLINAVDAEVVANKATVKVDGTRVVVAQVIGDKMVLTAEGEEMFVCECCVLDTDTMESPYPDDSNDRN